MKYIQYAIARKETGNASGKAKKDAFDIALEMGFNESYIPSTIQVVRVFQQLITMPKFIRKKVVFFQYPAVDQRIMQLFRLIVSRGSYKIALIHDLISIQGYMDYEKKKEADNLAVFDCLIVHNEKMKEYVLQIGYKGKIVVLGLFDYLHDVKHSISNQKFSNSIAFAGNLEKAKFLTDIGKINYNWILYGAASSMDFSNVSNVAYKGMLPSDKIQYLMEGDYGLVWDGDSIDTCSGPNGKYLKYNNPHKLSCFIAAGKPIITWKQAAIADFVEKNEIGITVNSLEELNNIDLSTNYELMRKNVLTIKGYIAEGKYLQCAIEKALELGEII